MNRRSPSAAEHADRSENTAEKPQYLYADLTHQVMGAFLQVHWRLGFGFVESVYANALAIELQKRGVRFEREVPLTVVYDGVTIGRFRADFVVDNRVLLELKSVERLAEAHAVQTLNYLNATEIELAMLLNFGPRPVARRLILSQSHRNRSRP
jgi:GxxExxY protein